MHRLLGMRSWRNLTMLKIKIRSIDIFTIFISITLIATIISMLVINYKISRQTRNAIKNQTKKNTITPHPSPKTNIKLSPVITNNINQKREIIYDTRALNDQIINIEKRQPLSQNDELVKNNILTILADDQPSGILYSSQNITIDYLYGLNDYPDNFQVEIKTVDVKNAKIEGEKWFIDKGLSLKAICEYPIEFYLSWETKQQLIDLNNNIIFSPYAPSCERN